MARLTAEERKETLATFEAACKKLVENDQNGRALVFRTVTNIIYGYRPTADEDGSAVQDTDKSEGSREEDADDSEDANLPLETPLTKKKTGAKSTATRPKRTNASTTTNAVTPSKPRQSTVMADLQPRSEKRAGGPDSAARKRQKRSDAN